jgi:hypothetical protein
VASVALMCAVAGCGSSEDSSSGTSSSAKSSASSQSPTSKAEAATPEAATPEAAAPEAGDHSNLLMTAADLTSLGEAFTSDPPVLNPNGVPGVAQAFHSADNTATIGDTILIFADPSEATNSITHLTQNTLGKIVTGAPEPSPVGSNGTVAAGTSPDGSKAVTVLMFTEGTAFVTLEFDSAPSNPVPPDFAQSVGQKQLDAIKAGMPS